jgi:hypothetical protein
MRRFRTRVHAYAMLVILVWLVIGGIVVLLLPGERVTRAHFDKIKLGMSLADVEGLLGPPDWTTRLPRAALPRGHELYEEEDFIRERWHSSELTIMVSADGDGKVFDRLSFPERHATAFDRVRLWIRRRLHF